MTCSHSEHSLFLISLINKKYIRSIESLEGNNYFSVGFDFLKINRSTISSDKLQLITLSLGFGVVLEHVLVDCIK